MAANVLKFFLMLALWVSLLPSPLFILLMRVLIYFLNNFTLSLSALPASLVVSLIFSLYAFTIDFCNSLFVSLPSTTCPPFSCWLLKAIRGLHIGFQLSSPQSLHLVHYCLVWALVFLAFVVLPNCLIQQLTTTPQRLKATPQ